MGYGEATGSAYRQHLLSLRVEGGGQEAGDDQAADARHWHGVNGQLADSGHEACHADTNHPGNKQ